MYSTEKGRERLAAAVVGAEEFAEQATRSATLAVGTDHPELSTKHSLNSIACSLAAMAGLLIAVAREATDPEADV